MPNPLEIFSREQTKFEEKLKKTTADFEAKKEEFRKDSETIPLLTREISEIEKNLQTKKTELINLRRKNLTMQNQLRTEEREIANLHIQLNEQVRRQNEALRKATTDQRTVKDLRDTIRP